MKIKHLLCTLLAFAVAGIVALPCSAQGQNQPTPPRVEIFGSQLLHIHSDSAGRDYDVDILLPGNYNDTTRRYPVIYHVDAQWDFPFIQAIYGQQYYDGFLPASIVVGITWGGEHPNYDSLRALDLSPSPTKGIPGSGNGPKFLSFIRTELIPMIDARYRTDRTNRTLMGSSFGGLFTLYALFEETSLFNRYVLTSPYLGYDNRIIDSFEKDYAAKRANTPVRVFIAQGGLEPNQQEFSQFVDHLRSQHYPGLELGTKIIEGVGHSGGKAEGFTRGLQWVFRRPALSLNPAVLDQYVGTYQFGPGVSISLKRAEDRLVVVAPGNYELSLQAETERDFYALGQLLNLHFKKDESGSVMGFELERYGREDFIKKVK